MIDFHCHLDLFPKPPEVVERCVRDGIYVLSVTTLPSAFEGTKRLVPEGGRIKTALGLHPELASARARELPLFEKLLPQTRYVGEVGIDGSQPHRATIDSQSGVFREILGMCEVAGGRILSLHSRGAVALVLDALEAFAGAGTFVLHWFSGSERQIEQAAGMGCWFSIGPTMLQTKRGVHSASFMPADRILPESDGPFGVANGLPLEPISAWSVVPVLARCWRLSLAETESRLVCNFRTLVSTGPGSSSDVCRATRRSPHRTR